ncbi:hypothetical protein BGX26_008391 [Mortierella sp. AD094]|nr:hypothetical protein BGX26_008391 [Mortierella sp. AD094]
MATNLLKKKELYARWKQIVQTATFRASCARFFARKAAAAASSDLTNLLTICCILDGASTSFAVDIGPTKLISHLKDEIYKKNEKDPNFGNINAYQLILYSVEVPDEGSEVALDNVETKTILKKSSESISKVLGFTPAPEIIHCIVQLPQQDNKRKTSGDEHEGGPETKKTRAGPVIRITGPLRSGNSLLMLPFTARRIFEEVYQSVLAYESCVIHRPYQSGKTSFLLELQKKLEETADDAAVTCFDIHYPPKLAECF